MISAGLLFLFLFFSFPSHRERNCNCLRVWLSFFYQCCNVFTNNRFARSFGEGHYLCPPLQSWHTALLIPIGIFFPHIAQVGSSFPFSAFFSFGVSFSFFIMCFILSLFVFCSAIFTEYLCSVLWQFAITRSTSVNHRA